MYQEAEAALDRVASWDLKSGVRACIKAQFMGLLNMVYGVLFCSPRNRKPPNDPPRKMKNGRGSNNDRGKREKDEKRVFE